MWRAVGSPSEAVLEAGRVETVLFQVERFAERGSLDRRLRLSSANSASQAMRGNLTKIRRKDENLAKTHAL